MATSIIDTLAQLVSPTLTTKLSATTGEPVSNIEKGLRAAIITMVGGLAARASDPESVGQIYGMAIEPTNDTSVLDSSEHLITRVTTGADRTASSNFIQSLLFGNRESSVIDALATHAGVTGTTAKSLLSIATSLVMAYLGRMIRTEKLDASALASRLMAERESAASALPAAMSKFLPTLAAQDKDRVAAEPLHRAVSRYREQSAAWAVVLPAVFAVLGAWALVAFLTHPRERNVALNTPEPNAVGTSGTVNREPPRELPGGVTLRFPANGTEVKLLSFIQGGAPVTKDRWFEFDRLNFETDSAVIRPESRDQMRNIATILRAYPATRVKIGGYTDNSGSPDANRQLSQARAEAVCDALEGLGVDPSRVQAEGYGDQHPVADNNTAEGRAKNRRVAILVTQK
jgi:outer membrane protein OmpA-like peptidoglycan-associated protein